MVASFSGTRETYRCDGIRRTERLPERTKVISKRLTPRFFLTTCLDQVNFMERLMQPHELRTRILLWTEEEIRLGKLLPKSGAILEAMLYRGELPRAETAGIVGTGERQARCVSALLERGVLVSESTRAPLRLTFPAALASR
jgi:hypothetical protein